MDNKQYLREKCEEGLIRRGINDKPHQERLNEELNVILDANLEDFFFKYKLYLLSIKSKRYYTCRLKRVCRRKSCIICT